MIENFAGLTAVSPDLTVGTSAVATAAYAFMALCSRARVGVTSALPYYNELQALDQIEEIAALENGWAGEGSLAPTERSLACAKYLAINLLSGIPLPDIAAMPNGTIAFDWETEKGSANLEIGDTDFSFYLSLANDEAFYPLSGALDQMSIRHLSIMVSALAPESRLEDRRRSTSSAMYFHGVERFAYATAAA